MINKGREFFILDILNEIYSDIETYNQDYEMTAPMLSSIIKGLRKACTWESMNPVIIKSVIEDPYYYIKNGKKKKIKKNKNKKFKKKQKKQKKENKKRLENKIISYHVS
jgi:hypothetical protein